MLGRNTGLLPRNIRFLLHSYASVKPKEFRLTSSGFWESLEKLWWWRGEEEEQNHGPDRRRRRSFSFLSSFLLSSWFIGSSQGLFNKA